MLFRPSSLLPFVLLFLPALLLLLLVLLGAGTGGGGALGRVEGDMPSAVEASVLVGMGTSELGVAWGGVVEGGRVGEREGGRG